jgi:hypothetical protein
MLYSVMCVIVCKEMATLDDVVQSDGWCGTRQGDVVIVVCYNIVHTSLTTTPTTYARIDWMHKRHIRLTYSSAI